jgi:type VI secretion system ImpA family protein
MSRLPGLETLIRPISESRPAGEDLYHTVYREIDEARPRSPDWTGKTRDPDWKRVVELGVRALQKQSKDLKIAADVTEALGWLDGLDGLRQGFELLQALQDTFWGSAYPLIEDNDYESRLAPYEFVEKYVPELLYVAIPLTAVPLSDNYHLQEFLSQTDQHRESRDEAIRRTDPSFHRRLAADLAGCRAAYDAWRQSTLERLRGSNPPAPSLAQVTASLDQLDWCLRTIENVRPFLAAAVRKDVAGPRAEPVEETPSAGDGDLVESIEQTGPRDDGEGGVKSRSTRPEPSAVGARPENPRVVAEVARDLADAGRIDAAIELLDRARQSARCRRDRFLRQLELVELCLRSGLSRVARPLLDELAAELEELSLEKWEDPALCARVLDAWLVCLRSSHSDEDAGRIPGIYERLCRLDPRSALRHSDGHGDTSH